MKKLLRSVLAFGVFLPLMGMDSVTDWGRDLDRAFAAYERISRAIDGRDMTLDAQDALRILNDFEAALSALQVRLGPVRIAIQDLASLPSWRNNHSRFFKLAQDLRVQNLTDRDEHEETLEIADGLLSKIEDQVAQLKIDIACLCDVLDAWNLDLAYEPIATAHHEAPSQAFAPATSPGRAFSTRRGWFYTFNKKMVSGVSVAVSLVGRLLMFAMAHGESLVGGEMDVQSVADVPAKRTIDASDFLESMGAAL